MDLVAVRTFVTVVDTGRFHDAAAELSVSQQAVSKRIAALEKRLGVPLFTRSARGATLTGDGQAFLPHARELLQAEARALASVRPGHRPLRVDVIARKLAPAAVLRDFRRAHPHVDLDIATLFDAAAAVDAVRAGTIDTSLRAVLAPNLLGDGITSRRVYDEPLQLLTGPGHPLADARAVTPSDLVGHRIWMPGLVLGTEWEAYYSALAAAFGLTIEVTGPDFGAEPELDTVAQSRSLAMFVGERTHLVWPAGHDLRRIELRDPTPVYPHSLLRRRDNTHPGLGALREYLNPPAFVTARAGTWVPDWARVG